MPYSSTLILASAFLAVIVGAAGLYLMVRRAAERAMSADQKANELQRELAELRARIVTAFANEAELSTQIADLRSQLGKETARADNFALQAATAATQIAGLTAQAAALRVELVSESRHREAASAQVKALADKLGELEAALAQLVKSLEPAAAPPPIDPESLRSMPDTDLTALAESLAALRPLVPYPKWSFDIDWANPDRAFQTRQQVWQTFRDRNIETPITVGWHLGTRLKLYLGNDLSRQIYVAGCIDPNEFAFLDRYLQPGMTFLDAGANEGIYAVFASARVGQDGVVWAIEPSSREFERLQANLTLNGASPAKTRVLPLALTDCNGFVDLKIAEFAHAGQNTLGDFANEGIKTVDNPAVEARRLDDLLNEIPLDRIDVMKLDVEGAELRALKGAVATLRKYRPVLLFEVSGASLSQQGSSREVLLAFLRANEYTPYIFDSCGLPALPDPGVYSDNMLALPSGHELPPAVYQPWPRVAGISAA